MTRRTRTVGWILTLGWALGACNASAGSASGPTVASPHALTVPAVSASAIAPPSATATAGPTAMPESMTTVAESARHRYRIAVPTGWTRIEYEGDWTAFEQFGVGVEVPGEDVIDSSALGAFLVMNSMAIPDGMTEAEWHTTFDGLVQDALPADCPGSSEVGQVADVEATLIVQACGGSRVVGRSLTHGGRGYYVTTVGPDDPAVSAALDELVASIAFLD